MLHQIFATTICLATIVAVPSVALGDAPKASTSSPSPAVHLPMERFTLANGLRVVLQPDDTIDTVAISVTYDVGSRNEVPGRTGFAHLFEHMMFQGSANVSRNEHPQLVVSRGGTLNAGTGIDVTQYFEVLPANELPLGLWLEADRMRSLDVSPENFQSQREVVKEEVLSGLNYPLTRAWQRRTELVLQGNWSYAHPTGGSVEDLDRAEFAWIKEFHAQYYGPNNAVLAVAGKIDVPSATALVHKYFDGMARVSPPPYVEPPASPEPQGARTEIMHHPSLRTPVALYGWAIPSTRHPDHYPLVLVTKLLTDGTASRLHEKLVVDKAQAQSVSASVEGYRRGPDLFTIDARLVEGASAKDVEQAIENELAELTKRPPSSAEMQRLHKRIQAAMLFDLRSNLSRSTNLGATELLFGDARLVEEDFSRYAAVTAEDIQRVVAKYLVPRRQVRIEVLPEEAKK